MLDRDMKIAVFLTLFFGLLAGTLAWMVGKRLQKVDAMALQYVAENGR